MSNYSFSFYFASNIICIIVSNKIDHLYFRMPQPYQHVLTRKQMIYFTSIICDTFGQDSYIAHKDIISFLFSLTYSRIAVREARIVGKKILKICFSNRLNIFRGYFFWTLIAFNEEMLHRDF